jgi:MSHA biogenesis protein MshO
MKRPNNGFTLIEMVVALVAGAIVIGFAAMMTTAPVNAYLEQSGRAEINDSVDIVIQRLDEDLRSALPNSVSIRNAGTRSIIEMIEVSRVVFYRASGELGVPPAENLRELQFPAAPGLEQNFSVFGFLDPEQPGPNYAMDFAQLVVGNRGRQADASRNAYVTNAAAGARLPPTRRINVFRLPNDEEQVTLDAGYRFSDPAAVVGATARNRMFIVTGATTYICNSAANSRSLRRYRNYGIRQNIATAETNAFLNAPGVENTLLADDVTACQARCGTGAAIEPVCSNTLVVQIDFGRASVSGGNERVRLHRQYPIDNDL